MPDRAAVSLDGLPKSFLRQLVLGLPAHAKLQLRQCCHKLLDAVDTIGVTLKLLTTTKQCALSVSSLHVRKVDTTGVQPAVQPPWCTALLKGMVGKLPWLQELRCTLSQLPAFDGTSGCRLLSLQLVWQEDDAAAAVQPLAGLPGLTTLTSLELDPGCHKFLTSQREPNSEASWQLQLLWSCVAAQSQLQSLVLQHRKPCGYSIDKYVITEQRWQTVIQQLTALSRLEMGSRLCSGVASVSSPAAGNTQQLATPVPDLKHLRCFGFDTDCEDTWNLAWVTAYSSLTHLDIIFCSAGEIDFDALGQLQQLRELSLHWYPDEYVTSSQLAPLSSCTQLTHLKLDSLLVEQIQEATARGAVSAAAAAAVGQLPAQAVTPTAWNGSSNSSFPTGTQQLTQLQKLVAGLMCKAPVAFLAPNLTHMRDLDYDLGELELPSGFIQDNASSGTSALAGLNQLQLLGVNMFALVRHSAFKRLSQLPNLTVLHIEMVGNLKGTHLAAGGLPHLPNLTKLVMALPVNARRNLDNTYSTEEDELIWQHQSCLRSIRLRGTGRLGGFMVHDYMRASMATRLPDLQSIELVKCQDLSFEQLGKFGFPL